MNFLTKNGTKTFNLLSIGQRGVGKTVFLGGSYAELHNDSLKYQELWFDSQDRQMQENILKLLSYIARTGEYPPPTMKVTNFSFSLKRSSQRGIKTLCHFRWSDIPGEICNPQNLEFQNMVSNSHGCCVFIDAYALVHNQAYLQVIGDILKQVLTIANLVSLNNLKYPFALILTKCDLLKTFAASQQQIEQRLQPFTNSLDAVKANYQKFYSFIPILRTERSSILKAKNAAVPLLWVVGELCKADNPSLTKNIFKAITLKLSSASQLKQPAADGLLTNLLSPAGKTSIFKKIFGLHLPPNKQKYFLSLILASASFLAISSIFFDYTRIFRNKADSVEESVLVMERLVQQKPEHLNLRLQLAHLYQVSGQLNKAEAVYDQVLAKQNNNLEALMSKAILSNVKGDRQTATTLFTQAEKSAPANLKPVVREVAKKTLQPPTTKQIEKRLGVRDQKSGKEL